MNQSWSDKIIMDDRLTIGVLLAGAGVQIMMMCLLPIPIFSACFAGGFIVYAAHCQIKRNERHLQLLAARLLYGHACDECFEHEGRWYCFYRDFVKGGR